MATSEVILQRVGELMERGGGNRLREVCALLQRERPHYHWVGFYFVEGEELVLGPFVGAVRRRGPPDADCAARNRRRRDQ